MLCLNLLDAVRLKNIYYFIKKKKEENKEKAIQ